MAYPLAYPQGYPKLSMGPGGLLYEANHGLFPFISNKSPYPQDKSHIWGINCPPNSVDSQPYMQPNVTPPLSDQLTHQGALVHKIPTTSSGDSATECYST